MIWEKGNLSKNAYIIVFIFALCIIAACGVQKQQYVERLVVGEWVSSEDETTFTFFDDNTFRIQHPTGEIVTGKYSAFSAGESLQDRIFILENAPWGIRFSHKGDVFMLYYIDDSISSKAVWHRKQPL